MSREMKHSGIEWIGEIPKDWDVKRAKSLFTQRNTKGNKSAVLLSATQKQGMMPQALIEGVVQVNNNTDLQTFKTVHINDYVISLRSFQGGFEKSNYEGVCSPAYQVFYNIAPIDYNYFWLLFKSYGFVDKINSLTVGIREGKNIQYKDFANMQLAVPSLSEQQKIADYLDKVCGEVDELVALQEQMIEELKAYKQSVITEAVTKGLNPDVPMKDSGIDWIGEIPEHYDICRVKNIASLFGRIGFRGYTSDDLNKDGEGAITLSPSNMIPMGMDYSKVTYLSWKKYEESPEIMIRNHDLLMVKTGSSYGKVSYVDNLPKEATINPQILRIVPSVNSKYLGYYMQTDLFIYQVEGGVVGGTIPTISQEKINNFYVILPNANEQQQIASYLDEKCSEIDALIAIKQQKIEEMKDYKKSVIHEYVTGKKEVGG